MNIFEISAPFYPLISPIIVTLSGSLTSFDTMPNFFARIPTRLCLAVLSAYIILITKIGIFFELGEITQQAFANVQSGSLLIIIAQVAVSNFCFILLKGTTSGKTFFAYVLAGVSIYGVVLYIKFIG